MTDNMDELIARAMKQSAAERKLLLLLAETISADLVGRAGEFGDRKRALAGDINRLIDEIMDA